MSDSANIPLPVARSRGGIHERVLQFVKTFGPITGLRALDAPLGPGSLALRLHQAGYAVSGVDIDLEQSKQLPSAIQRQRCNLNGTLPFPDATFDLVTSIEGIEHVENHFQMVREFGRVTRSGGHLIISTPNVCNLEERLNFLLRGSFYRFIPRAEVEQHGSGFDHQNLITYVELRQVLDWAGFEVSCVEKDAPKWKQNVFLFPVWLMLKLYATVQSEKRKQKYLLDETGLGNVLLGGNTIILLARKR